jgi:hypothetical protein
VKTGFAWAKRPEANPAAKAASAMSFCVIGEEFITAAPWTGWGGRDHVAGI